MLAYNIVKLFLFFCKYTLTHQFHTQKYSYITEGRCKQKLTNNIFIFLYNHIVRDPIHIITMIVSLNKYLENYFTLKPIFIDYG